MCYYLSRLPCCFQFSLIRISLLICYPLISWNIISLFNDSFIIIYLITSKFQRKDESITFSEFWAKCIPHLNRMPFENLSINKFLVKRFIWHTHLLRWLKEKIASDVGKKKKLVILNSTFSTTIESGCRWYHYIIPAGCYC